MEKRALGRDDSKKYTAILRISDSGDQGLCAALILAWADDEESKSALKAAGAKPGVISSAANFALQLNQLRFSGTNYFEGLCSALRASKDPFEILFFANRLWGDFGERGLESTFEAARFCTDDFVLPELLSYLAQTKDSDLAKRVVQYAWQASNQAGADNLAVILDSLIPLRPVRSPGGQHSYLKKLQGVSTVHRSRLGSTNESVKEHALGGAK